MVAAAAVLGLREILSQRELKRLERERAAAAAVLDQQASDRAWLFDQAEKVSSRYCEFLPEMVASLDGLDPDGWQPRP